MLWLDVESLWLVKTYPALVALMRWRRRAVGAGGSLSAMLNVTEARALVAQIAKSGLQATPKIEAIEALCVLEAHRAGGPELSGAAAESDRAATRMFTNPD